MISNINDTHFKYLDLNKINVQKKEVIMKQEYLIFILIIYFTFTLNVSCRSDKYGWEGSIEKKNNVTIVKNPSKPLYSESVISFGEDLSIGSKDGAEEYIFSRIGDIEVDDKGNIYVIDILDAQIRVFNEKGVYLNTYGGKGQGPGEMQRPIFMQITSKNELVVYDSMTFRFLYYSRDGKYLHSINTKPGIFPIKLDSNDNIICQKISAPPPINGKVLMKYDTDFNLLLEIVRSEKGKKGILEIGKPSCYCNITLNDQIVWGCSSEYKINVLNSSGKMTLKILKEDVPLKITEDIRNKYLNQYSPSIKAGLKLNFYTHYPSFSNILTDEDGLIYVKTYEKTSPNSQYYYFDVFDNKGIYLVKLPIYMNLDNKSVWKNNKLYTIETDQNDFQVVKRFDIKWNIRSSPKN